MNLTTQIAGHTLNNPLISVPGPIADYASSALDVAQFGAVVARAGGKYMLGKPVTNIDTHQPSVLTQAPHGLINAIALESDGVEDLMTKELPHLKKFDTKIIANIYGSQMDEYLEVSQKLDAQAVDFLELNISCPNIKGGIAFGTDPVAVEKLVSTIKQGVKKPVIVKLSPNVSYITEIAQAAAAGGADALSMINTVYGTTIDITAQKPTLATGFGGYSGPGILPLAIYAVHQCYQVVDIPIIGMGGVSTANDALQMLLAGASAVGMGSVLKDHLKAPVEIREGIEAYMKERGISHLTELIGLAHRQ